MYSSCVCSRPIKSSIFQSKSTSSSAPTISTALHGGDNIFKYNFGFSAIIDLSCFKGKQFCIVDEKNNSVYTNLLVQSKYPNDCYFFALIAFYCIAAIE